MSSPTPTTATDAPGETGPIDETEDWGFAKAMIRGSVVGIIVFIALIYGIVYAINASMGGPWSPASVGVIALWTGVWAGLFLGGTVSVGLWSHKRHS